MNTLSNLQPTEVWSYFEEICKVPRPSKHEEKIIDYLQKFGKQHNLETITDNAGNILIRKPATKGFEKSPAVVLQSHMDMVCEKNNDTKHNFMTDPIIPVISGEWVTAKGTTLGADDGIGMAVQLAILASKTVEHPELECLFTVDEETGLTGAFALQPGFLKGRTLINLDSEDDGEIFIGCAGGIDTVAYFTYNTKPIPDKSTTFKVEIKGLRGGHSGDDIDKGYGNANKILNRFLWNTSKRFKIGLNKFEGGNLRNAIPREAYAIITVKEKYLLAFETYFSNFCKIVLNEIKDVEPNIILELNQTESVTYILTKSSRNKLLNSLYACPNGVINMSRELPGLVETSTNLASVKMIENNTIEVVTSQRSSIDSAKKDIADMVKTVFLMGGAKVKHSDGYPGWKPNKDSELLRISEKSYEKLFSKKPVVRAIHAGLECGLFLEKYPDMDMISIGPTLRNVHSPDEKIHIATVEKFWLHLLDILKNL